ncbi:heme-binding protein, partial [Jeotgalicoccus huakuii]|nr:heme-binding protein [Jeotgalicoccus huakuii]
MIRKLAIVALSMAPATAFAQTLPSTPYLPLDLATKVAQAALDACVAKGSNVSVAVVARDGATKCLLKADLSGPHSGNSAEGKAFTAAALGRDSGEL